MSYSPAPNPWKNIPLVGSLIDGIQSFLVGLGGSTIPTPFVNVPLIDGVGAAGISTLYSRGDHVHPSDISLTTVAVSAADTDIPWPTGASSNATIALSVTGTSGTVRSLGVPPAGAGSRVTFRSASASGTLVTILFRGAGTAPGAKFVPFDALDLTLLTGEAVEFYYSGSEWIEVSRNRGAPATYTPVWVSSGTQPSLGNGSLTGNYVQVGKLVQGLITLAAGSTTTFGTGAYTFSIPLVAIGPGLTPVGIATGIDAGIASYGGTAELISSTTIQLATQASPQAAFSGTVPWMMGSGDEIVINFCYLTS